MDDEDIGYAIFFAYVLAHSARCFPKWSDPGTLSSQNQKGENLHREPPLSKSAKPQLGGGFKYFLFSPLPARWAPTSYKWSYNPYKWPYIWVTGVITPISGLITILITGRGPTLWGNDPIWRSYFSDGLVQPPTLSYVISLLQQVFSVTCNSEAQPREAPSKVTQAAFLFVLKSMGKYGEEMKRFKTFFNSSNCLCKQDQVPFATDLNSQKKQISLQSLKKSTRWASLGIPNLRVHLYGCSLNSCWIPACENDQSL